MNNLLIFILLTISGTISAQSCDTNALIIDQVRASDTDQNIPFELSRHHTFFNPDCVSKNVLLIHMVGTFASPYQSVLFPKHAANHGFHVLSLKYINDSAAQTACGNSNDIDCHYKFRKEIIDGEDLSTETTVDSVNSIQNRLIRLLQYMEMNNPTQNWGQYFTGDSIHWGQVMLSGHSQGGGHAAMMAIERPVQRVIMFASPNDYSINFSQVAGWTNLPHVTPDSAYYSFNNTNDQVAEYAWQFGAAENIGVQGDSTDVFNNQCPYGMSHNLFLSTDFFTFGSNHGSVVHDSNVPTGANGEPLYIDVWSYLLGIDCMPVGVAENEVEIKIYPNPVAAELKIQSETYVSNYMITDLLGAIVLTENVNADNFQVDFTNLKEGSYLLQFTTASGVIQKRIIKQ